MKVAVLAIGTVLFATLPLVPALAEEDDADDIVILSVQPRSPDVRPVMQAAPTASPTRHAADRPIDPAPDSKVASAKPQHPIRAAERS